ncbi:hypothetical protein L204_103966 [Cryptococcus depauperatus]
MQKRKAKASATGGDKGWEADTKQLSGSRQHAKAPTRLAGFVMGAAKGVRPIRHTHPARRGGGKGGCLRRRLPLGDAPGCGGRAGGSHWVITQWEGSVRWGTVKGRTAEQANDTMRSTILPSTQPPAGDYIHLNPHPDRHHQIDITKYIHLVPLVHPSSYAVGNPAHHQASPNRVVRVGTEGTLHRVEDEPHPSGLCGVCFDAAAMSAARWISPRGRKAAAIRKIRGVYCHRLTRSVAHRLVFRSVKGGGHVIWRDAERECGLVVKRAGFASTLMGGREEDGWVEGSSLGWMLGVPRVDPSEHIGVMLGWDLAEEMWVVLGFGYHPINPLVWDATVGVRQHYAVL